MYTYNQANNILQGRNKESKKIANNTYLIRHENTFAIRLHNTDVVTFNKENVYTLNSGGWFTRTTKDRINENSPARIWQEQSIWKMNGSLFFDGIRIDESGTVLNPKPFEKVQKQSAQLTKQIRAYIEGYKKHVLENGLEDPSAGDCWHCYFEGFGNDLTHIKNHIEEGYYVPSLLWKAINEQGYSNPALIWRLAKKDIYWVDKDLSAHFKKIKPKMMARE